MDKKCINQIFRPTLNVELPGKGNCFLCVPNQDNKNCSCYQGVNLKIHFYEISEKFPKLHLPSGDND